MFHAIRKALERVGQVFVDWMHYTMSEVAGKVLGVNTAFIGQTWGFDRPQWRRQPSRHSHIKHLIIVLKIG